MGHPVFMPAPLGRRRAKEPASWRERLEALRYVPALFRLIWRTHRGYTAAKAGTGSLSHVWRYLALELAIVLSGEILARASSLIESLLGDLFSNAMSVQLMEHAARLDLAQFEDPEFYDHLERARRQTVGRIALLSLLLSMSQDALTLITLAGALIAYNP